MEDESVLLFSYSQRIGYLSNCPHHYPDTFFLVKKKKNEDTQYHCRFYTVKGSPSYMLLQNLRERRLKAREGNVVCWWQCSGATIGIDAGFENMEDKLY